VNKKLKVIVATGVVAAVVGTGTALAIAMPGGSHPQSASTTTSTTALENIPAEVVSETTTTMPGGPSAAEVTAAQKRLDELGYWVGPVDGKMGQATQQALMAFQKIQGLNKSGSLDAATTAALVTASRPSPASTSGDLLEVDKTRQVIFVVRNGLTLWVFNTSTGTERNYNTDGNKGFAHTPTGTFHVGRTVDAVDPGPLGPLYRPRYFTNNGIAVHGAASIPAFPASHGCARVSNAAMDFIWTNNIMPVGSFVWVYDNATSPPFSPPTTAPSTTTTVTPPPTTTTPTTVPPTTVAPVTTTTTPPLTTTSSTTSTTI
jgi:peptidoglycan hydrolase-like protein with peptidoglycan-binding domain